ncbi:MAG: glycosyltransferase [Planctomycetes bacterium]|nr:glycosyltransferase [Planctomycetota bacterium]
MLPTLDGGERLRRCLDALGAQRPRADALVVVDSSSSDGSDAAARDAGADVLSIPRASFGHGRTRNDGAARLPEVDVIVFLVQDAVPLGERWLATLSSAALRDGVGAATSRQVAPPDAPPLARATVERSPMATSERRRTGPFTAGELAALDPRGWRRLLLLDDVACAVRGALFRATGFRDVDFGEDALLAYDLLWGGWALEHEPDAVVEHGHAYDPSDVGPRYEHDARFFRESFGFRARPSVLSALKGLCAEVVADRRWTAARRDASDASDAGEAGFAASVALRWAQVRAQRRGSRGPCAGPPAPRPVPRPEEL